MFKRVTTHIGLLAVGLSAVAGCQSTEVKEAPIFRKSQLNGPARKAAPGPSLYASVGKLHLRTGRLNDALKAFRRAVALDPKLAEARSLLGVTFDRLGRHDEALGHHRAAVKLQADDASLWNNLGYCQLKRRDWPEALTAFERAVELDAHNPLYRNNMGLTLALAGCDETALVEFTRAVGKAKAHFNLACVYFYQKREADAARHFQLARTLDPSLNDARVWAKRTRPARAAASRPSQAAASQPTVRNKGVVAGLVPSVR